MDFIDWRKAPDKIKTDAEAANANANRWRGKRYRDYVEELIQEAQERGEFSNLPGMGKPLNLEDDSYAGDNAMAYHLLKSNGFAPAEIELAKEIRTERERAEAKLAKIVHQGKVLRARRVPPFASERRAFNVAVEKAAAEYEKTLRELNRKILTLNLTAPPIMHQPLLAVEPLVRQFRESCPLFDQ
jgi:DnaJ family protein C protein 28